MIIYVDGCPNKVSFYVVERKFQATIPIPYSTNFEAEYKAIIEALKWVHKNTLEPVTIFSDSNIVVQQLRGMARVREPRLQILYDEVNRLTTNRQVFFEWVDRKHNLAGRKFE